LIFVILEISTSKFIPRTVNVVFPQERFQFSHSLSLLYFLLPIQENPKIKGIKVLHSKHEISQFADDTSVILDGSEESLNETLLELEWFKKISGLKNKFQKHKLFG
jgi:hypothetical protein